MTLFTLVPHPHHPPLAVTGVSVEVMDGGDEIELHYRVSGSERLIVPAPAAAERADDLWRTTCFELFVEASGAEYVEFNFSPSSRWAAYAFDGHRAGRRNLAVDGAPVVSWREGGVMVQLDRRQLNPRVRGGDGRMGLSAVIEEEGGRLSFWALAHPPGAADFHHADCFAATLSAVGRA